MRTDPHRRLKLLVDGRKACDSGIGTYIRNVVPRVLARLPLARVRVLVAPASVNRSAWLDGSQVERVEDAGRPLGLHEQWSLRRLLAPDEIFWATSLAHPLFRPGPMVATVHDVAQLALDRHSAGGRLVHLAARRYLQSLRRNSALLLFNSAFTEREFRLHVGAPAAASAVTPLGVAPEWFEALPHAPTGVRPYFICVGSIRPHKNLRTLLAAFARVLDQLAHDLVIVGRHEGLRTREGDFAQLLAPLGERVRFLGAVDDATLRQWVAGAQALVFPSLYEGFGLPALEAMAAGCPVIASSAGALPEVCGPVASYFDPHSVDALTAALLAHARMTTEARQNQVRQGLARARRYDWDRTADLTVQGITQYLEQRGRHG
ncbi:MAG: glycosyltransferase family 4 protein [Burkholderiales bacterium]|nr:glycosyltransferase family 4 protein [Burkholderiales bacterium]